MEISNARVSELLKFYGQLLEITGEDPFKIRAYERASETARRSPVPLVHLPPEELALLPGIGRNIAAKIAELGERGEIAELEELKRSIPEGLVELLELDGVGPKTVHKLWKRLGITTITELETAARNRRIRALGGFGPKKEEEILRAIAAYRARSSRMDRFSAERIIGTVASVLAPGTYTVAGSWRRGKSTIGDIDIISAEPPPHLNPRLTRLADEVIEEGDRNTSIRIAGQRVDIRYSSPSRYGTMLLYLTGSKAFNIRLRGIAATRGLKLNEYGITEKETGREHTFEDEESIFSYLGMEYIPPELREDHGEVEAALAGTLPELVGNGDIRGDLHLHSTWSDGMLSIEELARAGEKMGYEYIACTDHSGTLGVAGGLGKEDLLRQSHEIERVNRNSSCQVLSGVEVDILSDGRLGLPGSVLSDLDIVIAAIHSGFKQEKDLLTRRMIEAVQHDQVNIIAHPTGRLIGRREPYAIDMERVIEAARDAGTALEINASPYRLDLDGEGARASVGKGTKLAIGTDAHRAGEMELIVNGVMTARRGWCRRGDVINTLGTSQLLEWAA